MKKKINFRLIAITILAIALTVASLTLVFYESFKQQVREDLKVSAQLLKDTHYFESIGENKNEIDLSTDVENLRITWIDKDGKVLYDNIQTADTMQNHADRPEFKQALLTGSGECLRQSDTLGLSTFYYAVLLDNGSVLRVSMEVKSIQSVFLTAVPTISVVLLIILIICIVLSHFLTKKLIEPIDIMAKNIEDGSSAPPYKELVPFANTIRKQHADILSAAKMRQDFTANVSHELKTPLTAISGYAELIANHMVDDEQRDHFAVEIRKNSDRLLSLITDIIRLSELDRSEVKPSFENLDLYNLVVECMDTLRVNAENKNIEISFDGEHVNINCNREMIHELVENLVQNAIRYNNDGGKVWVNIKNLDGVGVVLTVKDNGIGIPKDEQSRVFERFYRVDKSRSKATGGTGLGLAIVKHIVEIHDAKIEMDSEVSKGTEIRIIF